MKKGFRPKANTARDRDEETNGDGRPRDFTNSGKDKAISSLQLLARRDFFATREVNRQMRALCCYVYQFLAEPGLPKGEFQKAVRASDAHVKNYLKTGDPGPIPVAILGDVEDTRKCLLVLEARQKAIEKSLQKAAKELHVYPWWDSILGCSAKGLGLIVGHAGNIGTFHHAGGLWKRMGMLNVKGWACATHKAGDLTKEEWTQIGYAPKRRSIMFQVVDSLLKAQRRVGNAELEAPERWEAKGAYGQLAIDRYTEALERHPDWKPMRRQHDVNRVVGKKLLSDLLDEWKAG